MCILLNRSFEFELEFLVRKAYIDLRHYLKNVSSVVKLHSNQVPGDNSTKRSGIPEHVQIQNSCPNPRWNTYVIH